MNSPMTALERIAEAIEIIADAQEGAPETIRLRRRVAELEGELLREREGRR